MKIVKITEFKDELVNPPSKRAYEGYTIETDEKIIIICIDNGPSCCERWGHISSEEDFDDFIGAEILSFRSVDAADYNEIPITKEAAGEYVDVFDCAFIDFNTSKGALQFAVYTAHNGYYGHDILIRVGEK